MQKKDVGRTGNSIRNTSAGVINKIVGLICPFVVRTVLIKQLGADYVGLNGLFTSILQVLNMAELGFSSAIVYSLYRPLNNGEVEVVNALMNLYKKIYHIIGLIFFGMGLALLPFLPYLIKGDCPSDINIYIVYLIYLFNTGISYFLFAYRNCILVANQRYDITTSILTIVMIVQYVAQLYTLVGIKNYYAYVIIHPICTVLANLVTAYFSRKYYPQYTCRGRLEKEYILDIKKRIGGLIIQKVAQVSRNSFDNVFITAFLGLTFATIYGNYFYIMSAVYALISVVIPSLTASVGNSIVAENTQKNYEDYKRVLFMYSWMAGWFSICLVCLYQPFMMIWVGEDYLLPPYTMILFGIYFYINSALGDIPSLYIQAAGLWWKVKKVYIFNAIANIVLNYLLVIYMGIFGIVLATVITSSFTVIFVTKCLFDEYFKDMSDLFIWAQQMMYALATLGVGVCTYMIGNWLRTFMHTLYGEIIVIGCVCVVIPNLVYALLYSKCEEYKYAKKLFFRILRRR